MVKKVGKTDFKNKNVEIINNDVIYFSQRRCLENFEIVSLAFNGVLLGKKCENAPMELKDRIKIRNDKETISKNSSVVSTSINLGRYIYEHSQILEEFAFNYYLLKIKEQAIISKYAYWMAREKIISSPWRFERSFKNINVSEIYKKAEEIYENDFSKKIDEEYLKKEYKKYYKDKKLLKYLTKWYKACGLSYLEYDSYEMDDRLIKMEYILDVLDNCLSIYKLFNSLNEGNLSKTSVNVTYLLEQDGNGNILVEKNLMSFLSVLYVLTISYCRSDYKVLKECEYCHDLFFGRKDKKCCSDNCKYKKNKKSQ